jgi:AhpD family alkylhydroperoxidase
MPFRLHDENTAPEASRRAMRGAGDPSSEISNVERVMAESPELLKGLGTLYNLYDQVSLSPVERNVVTQTANFENTCEYCVPWHTKACRDAGMSEADVQALRNDTPLSTPRLEALRRFTRAMILNRGKVSAGEREAFFAAGFTERNALEIVLGLAMKVMTNYTNSIAGTPLDEEVKPLAWKKPVIALGSLGET